MEENQKKSIWKKSIKEIWSNFKEFVKTPKGKITILIFLILLIILTIIGISVYQRYFAKNKHYQKNTQILPDLKEEKKAESKKIVSYLSGELYPEDVANRHPLAIMIENHPDARPQTGLSKAKVVYETITEGGITRFMALFGPESASKVGPVRSARTYYLDWNLEYDGFYAHCGGNLDALELIPEIGIKDLDQFKYGNQAYWREPQKNKATEHTMFTNTDKLWLIAKNNGWDMKADFDSLEFKNDIEKEHRPQSQKITIDFSTITYRVTWEYDLENNEYKRIMANNPHIDAATGEQLKAKNIIIQEVQRWYSPTSINEEGWAMKTIGEGKAKILIDGKLIEGKWKKENRKSRTQFFDEEGTQIQFNPGIFWYEIVPPGTPVH